MLEAESDSLAGHPTDQQWSDFLSGHDLEDSELLYLQQHLESCPQCQQRASRCQLDPLEIKLKHLKRPRSSSAAKLGAGYDLVEEVGRGASGIVYRAIHPTMQRTVAVKMLVAGAGSKPAELARFQRESAALSRLNHPQIVQVFDVGEQDGVPFLAMEWIEGSTLRDWMATKILTPLQSARIIAALAAGMQHAHEHGVLHRDLKPQNVLVASRDDESNSRSSSSDVIDRLKIVDFGLARFVEGEDFHTRTGETLGTPSYMAPEQIHSQADSIVPATDVYGLGAILYECLTGRPPFHGNSPLDTIQMVLSHDPVSIRSLRPGIPRDLAVICHRCLAKNPASRFPAMAELEADLQRFIHGQPILSRPVSVAEKMIRWSRRNPWPVTAAALLLFAIISTVIGQAVYQRQIARQRDQAVSDYQTARAAIWEMLNAANRESDFDIPRLQELRNSQLETAWRLFKTLVTHDKTAQAKLNLGKIQNDYGTSLVANGKWAEGSELLEQARQNFQQLVILTPDDAEVLAALVTSQIKLGVALQSSRQLDQSIQILKSTIPLARQLLERNREDANDPKWIDMVAWNYDSLGGSYVAAGDYAAAAREYQTAVDFYQQARQRSSDNDAVLRRLAESQISLAVCQMSLADPSADQSYVDAIESLNQILVRNPRDITALISTATAHMNRSNIFAGKQEFLAAVEACDEGIRLINVVLQANPDHYIAKDQASMLFGNRAIFKTQNEDVADSIADWRSAIEVSVKDPTRNFCRLGLISGLVSLSRLSEAVVVADELRHSEQTPEQRYQLACCYGVIFNALLVPAAAETAGASDIAGESETAADEIATNHDLRDKCRQQIGGLLSQLDADGYFVQDATALEAIANDEDLAGYWKTEDGARFLSRISVPARHTP